ncbi:Succinyl-CoA ligase [ADP-forming] subunit alpha [Nocardia cerradoensis]|uniref:Succinyl-CoA ligase [ADP-forming] subunit alpha n=3 Tax=Nocardia cerradoensis TaxID=85688 RepID=A0A231H225_9NOCA|nr:acetate--CoA ligase family protein [Nocardia cerradoensis]NKY43331.1 acetate--CoA ligase family protein [Nocardia cerradoensis]OXR42904.1 Succinyl-CoA ligase [ADP-forming] subunit alpha [Nocardia cerradoensis]
MTSTRTAAVPRSALDRLLRPESVAVVGASEAPGKLGSVMLAAVGRDGATATYGVNPRAERAGLHRSLRSVIETHGGPVDLAVLCVPASATPQALREAADCGVGAAVICSGGFAEAGEEGAALQAQVADIVAGTGIRVLGPNTSGFFRPGGVTVSFVPTVRHLIPGSVAVVAASGGMNHALSFLLSEHGVGVGLGVGLGNSVDVTATDVLRHLREDPSITAVALHVEAVADGVALLSAIRAVTAVKPVVALVVGRSNVSAFAASHTGALATSWHTTRSLLAEAGAVVVDSETELAEAVAVLSRTRLPATPAAGVGVVTAQAGPGLVVLDHLLAHRVRVPRLMPGTQRELARVLPPMTYQANPVDTGRPGPAFDAVLSATAADPGIDALAVYALAEPDAVDLADAVHRAGVHERLPVVLALGGPRAARTDTAARAADLGVPVLAGPTALGIGLRALAADARSRWLRSETAAERPILAPALPPVPPISLPADEAVAKDLLDVLGIATPPRRVCPDRAAAHAALRELPHPVAVKILDATVLHKTDIGGVHLNVGSTAELDTALDALDALGAPAYLVESMADDGVDLFLGVRRDPVFGPIVVAGLGGIAAEAIGDVTIRSGAVTVAGAAAMLDELRCAPLLFGGRGGPVLDRDEFARAAVRLVRYLTEHPAVDDIEVNPLRSTAAGLIALDAVVLAASHRLEGELP